VNYECTTGFDEQSLFPSVPIKSIFMPQVTSKANIQYVYNSVNFVNRNSD
jgi:hypothetical protein